MTSFKQRLKAVTPDWVFELRDRARMVQSARKGAAEIFSKIYSEKHWGGHDHDFFSGFGSHAAAAVDAYLSAVKPLLTGAQVVDLGCGDFNIGQQIAPLCSSYIGCDVVPALIERNKVRFPGIDFRCLDISSDILPGGEVALVRQVLQHLDNRQIGAFLQRIGCYRTLVVTEHLPVGNFVPNLNKPAGAGIRLHRRKPSGVVLTEPPFNIACKSISVLAEIRGDDGLLQTCAYSL